LAFLTKAGGFRAKPFALGAFIRVFSSIKKTVQVSTGGNAAMLA
jgi:hypothetical protein